MKYPITPLMRNLRNGRIRNLDQLKLATNLARHAHDAPFRSFERFQDRPQTKHLRDAPVTLHRPSDLSNHIALNRMLLADWQNVHPELKLLAGTLILKLRKMGIPLFVVQAYHSTKPKFDYGLAIQIMHTSFGASLSEHEIRFIAEHAMRLKHRDINYQPPFTWALDLPLIKPISYRKESLTAHNLVDPYYKRTDTLNPAERYNQIATTLHRSAERTK